MAGSEGEMSQGRLPDSGWGSVRKVPFPEKMTLKEEKKNIFGREGDEF